MKAAVLFSGGKDSTMAIYKAIEEGYSVEYLVSMISDNPESYMFHVPNIHITELSSEAMEIPLIKAKTHGVKEEELDDLKAVLKDLKKKGVEAIFAGALASEYQKSRIDKLCDDIGLISKAPLWHVDPKEYMDEIINLGFEVIIISVSAEGLDESWLGRKVDNKLLDEIISLHNKYGMHMAFEGGEAETLVLDCPIFKKHIKILESSNVWDRDNGYLLITKAELEKK
ncbi:MAG: TIGR00289 family protein [Methanobacterium sp.]|uniref:diphthine--ammonia ligase n=1 Tax=Methanobacterium sp. TaxID=2164 RepID=UPI003C741D15